MILNIHRVERLRLAAGGRGLRTGSVAGLVTFAIALAAPAGVAGPWRAVAVSGQVESWAGPEFANSWSRIGPGDSLTPLTQLRSTRRGRATLVREGQVLWIDPDSRLELPAQGAEASAVQDRGSVLYEIDASTAEVFRVHTPHLVAQVPAAGTTVFMITVHPEYATLSIEAGAVEVASKRTGERRPVAAGHTVMVDALRDADMELVARDPTGSMPSVRRETLRIARAEEKRLSRVMHVRETMERERLARAPTGIPPCVGENVPVARGAGADLDGTGTGHDAELRAEQRKSSGRCRED